MTTLAGPLLGLSFRRVGHHCGKAHTPVPLDNEQRRRALLQVWPIERHNQFNWQQSAANRFDPDPPSESEIAEAAQFKYGFPTATPN